MILKNLTAMFLLLAAMAPVIKSTQLIVAGIINKIEIEKQLENRFLITIETEVQKITWIETNKEVLIAGKLFDVKACKQYGEKLILTGVFDTAEDEIALLLAESENSKDEDSLPIASLLSSLFPAELFTNQFLIYLRLDFLQKKFRNLVLPSHCQTFLAVSTPPPNIYSHS